MSMADSKPTACRVGPNTTKPLRKRCLPLGIVRCSGLCARCVPIPCGIPKLFDGEKGDRCSQFRCGPEWLFHVSRVLNQLHRIHTGKAICLLGFGLLGKYIELVLFLPTSRVVDINFMERGCERGSGLRQ